MQASAWANNKMRLILTPRCNLSCFYCHNEGQPIGSSGGFFSIGWLRSIGAWCDAREDWPSEIALSGGEPTLHEHLSELVRLSAAISPRVTLVSNGLNLDALALSELRHAGLSRLRLGVDRLDAFKPRPSKGFLTSPVDHEGLVQRCQEIGIRVEINCVLSQMNKNTYPELIDFALRLGTSIKFFELVRVLEFGSQARPGTVVSDSRSTGEMFVQSLLTRYPDALEMRDDRYGQANMVFDVGGVEVRYCRYLCDYDLCWLTGTRVDSEGFAYTCMRSRGTTRVLPDMLDRLHGAQWSCPREVQPA